MFFGLGIHNTVMYNEALILTAKQKVGLEVLVYHASATMDDTIDFMVRLPSVLMDASLN